MKEPTRRSIPVVAGLCWLSPAAVLVHRRPEDASHGAGMLELPGGKIEAGESEVQALVRELAEEWGRAAVQLRVGPRARCVDHVYPLPGPRVCLSIFHVDARIWDGDWRRRVQPTGGHEPVAFTLDELPVESFLAADRGFLGEVRTGRVGWPFG